MAMRSVEHLALAMQRPLKSLKTVLGAAANSLRAGCKSRSVAPAIMMPASIGRILMDCSQYTSLEEEDVPEIILCSPVWECLAPLPKYVYGLCWSESVAAVLVVVHNTQLVIKAWPAERASDCREQIEAEIDASRCFARHPLMATMVATCFDEEGNFFSVSPYAGCSLDSLINHPDWFTAVSDQDRLEFVRLMVLQMLTVFDIMQRTGPGHFYRDVKPDNVVISPTTGLTSVIDYGLKVWSTLENFYDGETPGYWTPEMISPGRYGNFETYYSSEKRQEATNSTTDTFLASYVALQAAVGLDNLPWRLRHTDHDMSTSTGFEDLMWAHAMAAVYDYDQLIARVACPVAKDFFHQTMCTDPAERLTPAQALQHPWLAGCTAAVQQVVAAATPACQQVNQQLVNLFSGVPGALLPQQQQQQEDTCIACTESSSASLDVCCGTISTCCHRSESSLSNDSCTSLQVIRISIDEAAADQNLADSAAEPPNQKPSLLQRGKKLLSKLSRSNSSSSKGFSTADTCSTKAVGGSTAAVVMPVQAWVDDEPDAVSVPGLCGLRWFGGHRRTGC